MCFNSCQIWGFCHSLWVSQRPWRTYVPKKVLLVMYRVPSTVYSNGVLWNCCLNHWNGIFKMPIWFREFFYILSVTLHSFLLSLWKSISFLKEKKETDLNFLIAACICLLWICGIRKFFQGLCFAPFQIGSM